jgi:NAD(P)-dependent dehydrogenase (short-subunit alcohol dehydrogenase family)
MPLSPSIPAARNMLAPASFAGTTVFIVAGDHDLCEAIAGDFAHYGASVAVAGDNAERCQAIVEAVEQIGAKAIATPLSATDPESVAQAFAAVEQTLGPVTILVNPYSAGHEIPAEQISPTEWRTVTDTLLDGSFFCAQEFARRRIADEAGGVIVNFATPYVPTGGAGLSHLETAKAGLAHLTKSLAVEWAPFNIRVNAVAPGYLSAPTTASSTEKEQAAFLGLTIPAGRVCEPFEVSACVLYMCTPHAAYLTGHIFDIDGASWQRPGRTPPKFEPVRSRYARQHQGDS